MNVTPFYKSELEALLDAAEKQGTESKLVDKLRTAIKVVQLPEKLSWEDMACLGLTPWICSDCCASFYDGMPKVCIGNARGCNEILERDHANAQRKLNGNGS